MTAVTEEPAVGEIVPYAHSDVEEYRPRIMMAPEEAKALDDALRANMLAVLRKDVDYGVIPGTGDKPTLLKPGAEKLLQWFGYGHKNEQIEVDRDADGRRLGVTYKCTVTKTLPGGSEIVIATCDGYAGYDEDRFYTTAEQAEAKERALAEQYKRSVRAWKCAEYKAPWNSLIKMAQKRSLVGATLPATSASSLFTQDMEDAAEAQGAVQPAALAAAGRTAIGRLPQAVRTELDAWYSALNWPGPDAWDAEQWCTALVQAGRLSAGSAPHPPNGNGGRAPQAEPAAGGQPAAQDAAAGQTWLDSALERARTFTTVADGEALWNEGTARERAGELAKDDANRIAKAIKRRLAELRKPAEPGASPTPARTAGTLGAGSATTGTDEQAGLDPEDPWAPKVESVASQEDADAAKADVRQQVGAGHLAEERGDAIINAINLRVFRLLSEGAAA